MDGKPVLHDESDRRVGLAVAAYQHLVKTEMKARLAERDLHRAVGALNPTEMGAYLRATDNIDQAMDVFAEWLDSGAYADSTIQQYLGKAARGFRVA